MGRASKYAKFNLGSEGVVENGEPVVVFCIVLANGGTTSTVSFEDADGNPFMSVIVGLANNLVFNFEFLAYNGIVIKGSTAISATVFHSQPGA